MSPNQKEVVQRRLIPHLYEEKPTQDFNEMQVFFIFSIFLCVVMFSRVISMHFSFLIMFSTFLHILISLEISSLGTISFLGFLVVYRKHSTCCKDLQALIQKTIKLLRLGSNRESYPICRSFLMPMYNS
jgi:hypothetical protein